MDLHTINLLYFCGSRSLFSKLYNSFIKLMNLATFSKTLACLFGSRVLAREECTYKLTYIFVLQWVENPLWANHSGASRCALSRILPCRELLYQTPAMGWFWCSSSHDSIRVRSCSQYVLENLSLYKTLVAKIFCKLKQTKDTCKHKHWVNVNTKINHN